MTDSRRRILIVEDQFLISEYLRIWIDVFGHDVVGVATSAVQAVQLAVELKPDIVLMDMRLDGERDGVAAAREIFDLISTRIIYITGADKPGVVSRIGEDHPFQIIAKPIDPAELQGALAAAAR
jgi:AmiR/NasT family two-component response regulator